MRWSAVRRWRLSFRCFLALFVCFSFGFLLQQLSLRYPDPSSYMLQHSTSFGEEPRTRLSTSFPAEEAGFAPRGSSCATVEEMGLMFDRGGSERESFRVRRIFRDHFAVHGAAIVRELPTDQFCRQGFVFGKASEAGFGNEMYKILTAAALSVLLNRSLIIGQTRGKFPFGDYVSYTDLAFTLKEVKHLWRKNDCLGKYGRHLVMRTDDFEKPAETNVLCSNWRAWKQPVIWFQGTTDAVAIQFFLKNVHPRMRNRALTLFGDPRFLRNQPNVFGELMRFVVSPMKDVEEAINWVLDGGPDPDVSLHMRMMTHRSKRAVEAALNCIKKALSDREQQVTRPRLVFVSDTPSLVKYMTSNISEFAEVLHFNYESFEGNISIREVKGAEKSLPFRAKDWGPAPRWVMFVDFFLASRAKHAVVSGAHRRVGTTYAQLIAALAAANRLGEGSYEEPTFSFFSSFQSSLLVGGLGSQVGWGHAWNRYGGSLSCRNQPNQCALTSLLPSGWWDQTWQSPIPRDIRRMQAFGVHLTDAGEVIEDQLRSFCRSRKEVVKVVPVNGYS